MFFSGIVYTERVKKARPLIRFGSYLLVRKIASGGMADIFLAHVTGLRGFSKPVAIKKIHPHLLRQVNFLNMFIDEAKIASKLVHPNIVQIYELGQVGGQPFIAMEYVQGRDLYELLHRLKQLSEPCPWPLAVRVALEVARALHHAHEFCEPDGRRLEIVHRDVSPRNILISFSGDVKLTDFGVARARDREEMTQAGVIKGKVRYISPEAARGEEVDARSDVFSLGVVLAEMLTMEAFRRGSNNLEILAAIRKGVDRDSHFDALPRELIYVLSRALDRDRERRYHSAREFIDELQAVAVGPIAPMPREEMGQFLSGVFAAELEEIRRWEKVVKQVLLNWEEGTPARVGSSDRVEKEPRRPREKASLSGQLRKTSVAALFASMFLEERTGRLELIRSPVEKSLFFARGQILDVSSNIRGELFGEFLVARGRITRDELEDAVSRSREEGLALTDFMLREKILAPGELFEKLSEQLHSRVLEIFCWPDGEYFFFPEEIPEGLEKKRCLDTMHPIQIWVLEFMPPEFIKRYLGDDLRKSAALVHTRKKRNLVLAGRMQALLGLLEKAPKPVSELQSGEGDEEFSRTLFLLRELGLIRMEDMGLA